MTPQDITYCRLWSQQIAHTRAKTPAEVVAGMGAMQAQDYSGAKWAIGLRLPHATDADIEQAAADRTIVRTWPMRGTLHFVAAEDVRWMLELMTPRVIAGSKARQQMLELDDTVFARCKEVFFEALQGGKQRTRDEMYQILERAGISNTGQRGYHILWRTAQDGLICFAAHSGKQPTFALLEEWIPGAKGLERGEALAELAKRYFTGHGPATVHDFAWWSGLTVSDAHAGLASVGSQLVQEIVDGKTYWMSPEAQEQTATLRKDAPCLYLLPGFDEYLLGYKDRSAALDPAHASRVVPGNNGIFMPTIVHDGRIIGLWKRAITKRGVTVTAAPFSPLGEAEERAFEETAQRYRQYLAGHTGDDPEIE